MTCDHNHFSEVPHTRITVVSLGVFCGQRSGALEVRQIIGVHFFVKGYKGGDAVLLAFAATPEKGDWAGYDTR